MSLQPPRDESLNGLLQGYRIYYRELESETGMSPEPKTLKSPSALRAELTGEQCSSGLGDVHKTTLHVYLLRGRHVGRCYKGAREDTGRKRAQCMVKPMGHR